MIMYPTCILRVSAHILRVSYVYPTCILLVSYVYQPVSERIGPYPYVSYVYLSVSKCINPYPTCIQPVSDRIDPLCRPTK